MQKSGIKTSEFWITAGANIIALLALGGVFNQADVPQVAERLTQVVGSVFAIIANVTYVWSRTVIKKTLPNGE